MAHKRNFLAKVGKKFLDFLEVLGRLGLFAGTSIKCIFSRPFYFKQLMRQCVSIGYYSLPVVAMTTIFTGMALALQTYSGFSRFSAEGAVATVVVLAITRELAPVMAGLMVAGRVGAAIAAEIGTMKVTEQIDALTTLSTNPHKYLVVPRLIAGTLMVPLLVMVGDILGIFGGFIVAVYTLNFNASNYIRKTVEYLEPADIYTGLIKAAVFGFIVTLMGCYHGYHSRGGAQGVGSATMNAVVSSSVLILIANYIVTDLMF